MEVAKMIPTTPLNAAYPPWTRSPFIASAPMRLIALAPLAYAVSLAGGLGFLAAGTDLNDLKRQLRIVADLVAQTPLPGSSSDLPIGVGFINWGVDLETALEALREYIPAAVWLFAPRKNEDLVEWTKKIREVSKGKTKIWIQIGTVTDAIEVARSCHPDVLVVQGADAGGHGRCAFQSIAFLVQTAIGIARHVLRAKSSRSPNTCLTTDFLPPRRHTDSERVGLAQGAGIVSLLPEVADEMREMEMESIPLVAAGGIVEGRGVAAALALGAGGVVMGTRFLASKEADIAKGYQYDVLRTKDGGKSTIRTGVYDILRGTKGWPDQYNGRGIINQSYLDAQKDGRITDENKKLYEEALQKGDQGWGENGRVTAYAGCGVGLVKEVKYAKEIMEEVRQDAAEVLSKLSRATSKL